MGRKKERSNIADARGSGDDQTERDGEEDDEHLQPYGTMARDDILFYR